MRTKAIRTLTLALALGLVVGACGGGATTDAQPVTTDAPGTSTTAAAAPTTAAVTPTTQPAVATTVGAAPSTGEGHQLKIEAVDNEGFSLDKMEAPAGKEITVTFVNKDSGDDGDHNWHLIVAPGVKEYKTEVLGGPSTESVTFTILSAGDYTYVCDTHTDTMQGVLTITP